MHKLQAAQHAVNAVLAHTVRFNLNNNLMKCGSTSFRLTDCDFFFTHVPHNTAFIFVTVARENGVAVHDVRTEIYDRPTE